MPRRRHQISLAFVAVFLSASAVSAQCRPDAISTLPSFDALGAPHASMTKAQLQQALALSWDTTQGGLWRQANMELALAAHDDPDARDSAIRHLAQIIQTSSQNPAPSSTPEMSHVLYRLGVALAARRDFQRARQVFHRLIRHYPTDPLTAAAYLHFGEFYLGEGDHQAALRFIERAEATTQSAAMRNYTRYLRVLAGEAAPLGEIQAAFLNERSAQGRVYAEHIRRHCS